MTARRPQAMMEPLPELPPLPDALCRGIAVPDVFFPTTRDMNYRFAVAQAKNLCAQCPDREPCLAWALANPTDGILGGTTEGERRTLRRKLKAKAKVEDVVA